MKNFIDEREKIIIEYIRWKECLDIWVWDTSDRFLHKYIAENSKSVIWIELSEERAKKLIEKWYNICIGDAEKLNLNKKFEVIIAWDLIEHLNNPWLFLDWVKNHLLDNGVLILNTPNIYSINYLLRWLLLFWNVRQFNEHVIWFNDVLIKELLKRYDFKIEKFQYYSHKENTLLSYIIRFFWLFSKKWLEHMIIICKK